MSTRRKSFIVSTLRTRIEHALRARALSPGDRLPSTRKVGKELGADPRVVMAAYQVLADEGLVELRPRSGAYVGHANTSTPLDRTPPKDLLTDILVAGIVRGFSLASFTDHLRIAGLGQRLRATVIAPTADHVYGLARELNADYGLSTSGLMAEQLKTKGPARSALERTHVIVTTQDLTDDVERLATSLGKPMVVAHIRPPFLTEDWKKLLRFGRVYMVAVDERFVEPARLYLKRMMDIGNVRFLIAGKDDLAVIPPQAPTYVTEAARHKLGRTRIPGQLISPARLLAEDSVRALISFIVAENLELSR